MKLRPILDRVTAHEQLEGGGFRVKRPFPSNGLQFVDPLLLLDELGPVTYGPGEAIGAPDHPHRGFETVTYVLQGEGAHADSAGNAGTLGAGDVQWMTAGDGVVHREMPSLKMQREGGTMHGFQLWVNLPRKDKRIRPRYQEIKSESLPTATTPDEKARVKVIAGEALGARAVIETRTPILYHHWILEPGASVVVPTPEDHNVCVYVFEGTVIVDGLPVERGQLAVLGEGEGLELRANEKSQCLVLGGRPLHEPVAWGGPFVMNTREEVMEAFRDFQMGKMGTIPAEIVRA